MPQCLACCQQVNSNIFRNQRLYNEDVDLLLKEKKAIVQSIFEHYRKLAVSGDDRWEDPLCGRISLMSETTN